MLKCLKALVGKRANAVSWVPLCNAGTLAAALHAPTLRPWGAGVAGGVAKLLGAVDREVPTSLTAQPGFWGALALPLATAPGALAALAMHRGGFLYEWLVWLQDEPETSGGGFDAVARSALLNACWPVAPLLRLITEDSVVDFLNEWSKDVCIMQMTMAPPGAPQLAACVSAALLAPRLPRAGVELAALSESRAPLLAAALLAAAAAWTAEAEAKAGAAATTEAHYRFKILAGAIGALAVEAFPLDNRSVGDTRILALPEHEGHVQPFEWRRTDAADDARVACKRPRFEGSDAEGEDGDTDAPPGQFTRADVNVRCHGTAAFLVGGQTVHAFGCVPTWAVCAARAAQSHFAIRCAARVIMARASSVLREAISAASGDGDDGPLTPVPLPALLDLPPALHHALFLAAVEHTCVAQRRALLLAAAAAAAAAPLTCSHRAGTRARGKIVALPAPSLLLLWRHFFFLFFSAWP